MFVQWLGMSEINKDDVTLSVIAHYKSMGSPPRSSGLFPNGFSLPFKSTAGILMRDERALVFFVFFRGRA